MPSAESSMWRSELIASDAIGRVIAFWGFKRNLGRVWTVLYLSDAPLTAADLRERLQLSTGAVSMTLTELSRWGIVRKVWIQGDRRDYFTAEGDLWKMVSRVLRERELVEVGEVVTALEDAVRALDERTAASPEERRRADVQRQRLTQLLDLAKLGRKIFEVLISEGRVDASGLARFLLGRRD